MGSTSHLANELGNEDRDHSTTDGCIMYCRTLYARIISVYLLDLVSIEVLPPNRLLSVKSGKVL